MYFIRRFHKYKRMYEEKQASSDKNWTSLKQEATALESNLHSLISKASDIKPEDVSIRIRLSIQYMTTIHVYVQEKISMKKNQITIHTVHLYVLVLCTFWFTLSFFSPVLSRHGTYD